MKVLPCFMLAVLLSAGTIQAVDVNWLTGIIKAIRTEYKLRGQFCLAATIPGQQDPNTLISNVLHKDRFDERMEDSVKGGEVYVGSRVVLAVPIGPVHAEHAVLPSLGKLKKQGENDFLLIYSYLSPCSSCTDHNQGFNILKMIENQVRPRRSDKAFVFTKVFSHPKDGSIVTRDVLVKSLTELSNSMGGLQYIFRCDGPSSSELECHSCSVNHRVSEFCIDNNAERERSISRERSRSSSGSRGGGRRSSSSSSRERSRSFSGSRGGGRRSSSSSRERSRSFSGSRGGGRSRKREMYRSQSESSISSGNSREAGKHEGGGRSSRKRSKYRSSRG
ncbi:uncharacterized protein LOC102075914 [Oreochromis niloticus]|uniref:uncharacterized protein LOC102075914 n=1 Tax=Oreochromis niloticus TaxID=8128 RepID=UPI0003944FDD|nr:uncharacterized protein LOC102075914 [Oreochromis niloticus]